MIRKDVLLSSAKTFAESILVYCQLHQQEHTSELLEYFNESAFENIYKNSAISTCANVLMIVFTITANLESVWL